MKNYIIRKGSDASEGHIAKIETYAWEENGYAPETQGRITSDGERLLRFRRASTR